MDLTRAAAPGATESPDDPREALAQIRARLAAGEPLQGRLATAFYRAVNAVDPDATEESLATLPGNRGVNLYDTPLSWVSVMKNERVLDIGCGAGGATRAAARAVGPDGMVVGVDPSPEALARARALTDPDLPVAYVQGSAERLPSIPDRSFDCVVMSLVLEQVNDLERVLSEAHRALRPGGRLVASVMAFDRLRPLDASLMGAVVAVVARHAPGALSGRASAASIPHEPRDAAAFRAVGLNAVEELEVQLAAVMETEDDAWRLFSRTCIRQMLDDEGVADLRRVLRRRMPHTLYLPVRLLRTRRPG
jgi:SAM-dependent methyltransferase